MIVTCIECERVFDADDEYATKWEPGDWVPYGDGQAQLPGHMVCACGGELEDYEDDDDD